MNRPAIPRTLKGRPTYNNYIVPYFVSWYHKGKKVNEDVPGAIPAFPIIDMSRASLCRRQNLCWVCGNKMGSFKTFVIGPVAALARQSAEPASHRDCALYAAQVCPFMVKGYDMLSERHATLLKQRDSTSVHPDITGTNPHLAVLWTTKSFTAFPIDVPRGIYIYDLGEAVGVRFFHHGREATYDQCMTVITKASEDKALNKQVRKHELELRLHDLIKFVPGEC
jgi:hypothetical protein